MVVWMVKAAQGIWEDGEPEYYRIIYEDGKFEGQYYYPRNGKWMVNSSGLTTLRWLFVDSDILITEIE